MKKILWCVLGLVMVFAVTSHVYNHQFSRTISLSPQNGPVKCNAFLDKKDPTRVRILVIDGGGIDGIMPLVLLRYLEEKTGKPIADLFDFFTGTSTGSIIVSSLNVHDEDGKPRYSAGKLLEIYKDFSKEVLAPSVIRSLFTLHGLIGPHLSIQHLHQEFLRFLGDKTTFGALLKKVAITVYDIERNTPELLNSWECDEAISRYLLADVITAATATPTFFAPTILTDYDHHARNVLVDGGIFTNNPSLDAIREALALYPHASQFLIVHLGTGGGSLANLNLRGDKIQYWGFLHWLRPIISIVYKSQNIVIRDAIRSIQNFSASTKFDYYYFNKNMKNAAPFDTTKANIDTIEAHAHAIITEQGQILDKVAQELLDAS